MSGGYVERSRELRSVVRDAERLNRPVFCWPEDVGHITPADLPFIDLGVATREFVVMGRNWHYSDSPLDLPTPGTAYAVVEEIEGSGGTKMEVVAFRPKTADECQCDEDRERELNRLTILQDELLVRSGYLIEAIADEFIDPDISWESYPKISNLLDVCEAGSEGVRRQWVKVESGNERDAGTTE